MRRIYYGYWVLVACSAITAVGGAAFHVFSLLLIPVSIELKTSRTLISLVFSVARLFSGLVAPGIGWLVGRVAPRTILIFGAALGGIGLIILSQVTNVWVFTLVYTLLVGLGWSAASEHAAVAPLVSWFVKKRATALSIRSAAFSLGGAAILPLFSWLILCFGWRTAVLLMGVAALLITIPVSLLVKRSPKEIGLLPNGDIVVSSSRGDQPRVLGDEKPQALASAVSDDRGVRGALNDRAFWILTSGLTISVLINSAVVTHFVPIFIEKGTDQNTAATLASLSFLVTGFLRVLLGWIGDVWSKEYLLVAVMISRGIAFMLLFFSDQLWQLYLFVFFFGAGNTTGPLCQALLGDYFGQSQFASLRGIVLLVATIGIALGPITAGLIYDITGSYQLLFLGFIGLSFLGAVLFSAVCAPSEEKHHNVQ